MDWVPTLRRDIFFSWTFTLSLSLSLSLSRIVFSVTNGVRQGGILSHYLFNVYIDELFERFDMSGVGCRYLGTINHLCYANDIVLVSPTPQGFQKKCWIFVLTMLAFITFCFIQRNRFAWSFFQHPLNTWYYLILFCVILCLPMLIVTNILATISQTLARNRMILNCAISIVCYVVGLTLLLENHQCVHMM